jgi:16S rRNA (guanine527-N7)-methyltransferase
MLVDALMDTHRDALTTYVDRLMWWNRKVNLVSRDMSREDVLLHVKHSLFLAPVIQQSPIRNWVDTGTGGGLPGIPLAIVCKDHHFTLNDVVEKKGTVLKDIVATMSLHNARVEIKDIAAFSAVNAFGIVTKHAFKMADLIRRLDRKPWQEMLMLKGSDYSSEINDLSERSLTIEATSLEAASPQPFFSGKYLIRICPTP